MARNPFGSQEAHPRNLDNEHLYAQWFRVADKGAKCCDLLASLSIVVVKKSIVQGL